MPRHRLVHHIILGKKQTTSRMFIFATAYSCISFIMFHYYPYTSRTFPIPPVHTYWQLVFLIPIFGFTLYKTIYTFLYRPRSPTIFFIASISYGKRRELALLFLKEKARELLQFILFTIILIDLLQIVVLQVRDLSITLFLPCFSIFEGFILYYLCRACITTNLWCPTKKDQQHRWYTTGLWQSTRQRIMKACLGIAEFSTKGLKGDVKIITKRQILYLLRCGGFIITMQNCLAFIGTIVLLMVIKEYEYNQIALFLILFLVPLTILSSMVAITIASAQKLQECSYYAFKRRTILIGNSLVSLFFCLPYILLLFGILIQRGTASCGVLNTINYVFSLISLIGIYSIIATPKEIADYPTSTHDTPHEYSFNGQNGLSYFDFMLLFLLFIALCIPGLGTVLSATILVITLRRMFSPFRCVKPRNQRTLI